jgi:hypothetical protein
MSDKLVFDLAQEVEGSPNVFIRKDWINILDNQNQNYNNNQSIIDTSQLSNSNKYMSYREAYLLVPMNLTLGTVSSFASVNEAGAALGVFAPATTTAGKNAPTCLGLKNWFGQIIHSMTLDYNGTTIIQQTPYINMWNSFKLMTTLSLDDINTQGSTIGFFPDEASTFEYYNSGIVAGNIITSMPSGQGVCNNTNYNKVQVVNGQPFNFNSGGGNLGYARRQSNTLIFDTAGVMGVTGITGSGVSSIVNGTTPIFGLIASNGICNNLWKSYIYNKVNQVNGTAATTTTTNIQTVPGLLQIALTGIIYLKHIHSFFNMVPLLKGVFMKMTLNLNNATTGFTTVTQYGVIAAGASGAPGSQFLVATSVSVPIGGVNPLMITSTINNGTTNVTANGGFCLTPGILTNTGGAGTTNGQTYVNNYRCNVAVGSRCLDSTLQSLTGIIDGPLSKSVYLYIPAYDFNPVFESAYLSSPVKTIRYTDIYQYQVLRVEAEAQFNNLLSNGIRNIKSILILPFYSTSASTNAPIAVTYGPAALGSAPVTINPNTGFISGIPVFQSPFDTAGTGTSSPMTWITNFNVQVSGQNAIYNTQKYNFEQFNNQLYGQNSVNGGLTDGLTSGLVDRAAFDLTYCYYYVNIERMRPVEMSVPKSIQIIGQNQSVHALDLYCFIEYGNQIDIDVITGARVG